MILPTVLDFAHTLLQCRIRPGDRVIDGTAGNGYDTLMLARSVGAAGRVFAFDIQAAALANTAARLQAAGIEAERVQLIQAGHEHLGEWVAEPVAAAVFNFGYLPRGDKRITTQADTSLQAVRAALERLQDGGLLVMVLYHGHPAGKIEKHALSRWAAALPQPQFRVLHYAFANQRNHPPELLAVEKNPSRPLADPSA